jgi:hypothetical protein
VKGGPGEDFPIYSLPELMPAIGSLMRTCDHARELIGSSGRLADGLEQPLAVTLLLGDMQFKEGQVGSGKGRILLQTGIEIPELRRGGCLDGQF